MTLRLGRLVVAVVAKRQVAISYWPAARLFVGFSWIKGLGACVDWKDRTYLLTGEAAKIARRPGQLIARMP